MYIGRKSLICRSRAPMFAIARQKILGTGVLEMIRRKFALDAAQAIASVYEHYKISRGQLWVSKRVTENLPRDIVIYLVRRFCCIPCQVSVKNMELLTTIL